MLQPPKCKYRVVLDTNQIVGAGTRWLTGALGAKQNHHREILVGVAKNHVGLYCGKTIGEYLEKLVDQGHPQERSVKLIAYIMGAFTSVQVTTSRVPHLPTDPDDEIFLLCAIDGFADFLVTEDGALLKLSPNYSRFVIDKAASCVNVLGT